MKGKRTIIFGLVAVALASGATFDVASVRANKSGPQGTNIRVLPNGVNMVNVPLRAIIQLAYGVQQPSRLAGVPNWAVDERYDVNAKSDETISRDQLRSMLQELLADRFKLAAHMETREQPIYVLTQVHPNPSLFTALREQLGLQLKPEREKVDVLVVDRVDRLGDIE